MSTGKPVVASNLHKVITKGKMQQVWSLNGRFSLIWFKITTNTFKLFQLVLKPTTSIVAQSQRPLSSASKPAVKDEKQATTAEDTFINSSHVGDAYPSLPTMPMHAAPTIKALMAIQISAAQERTEITATSTASYSSQVAGQNNAVTSA